MSSIVDGRSSTCMSSHDVAGGGSVHLGPYLNPTTQLLLGQLKGCHSSWPTLTEADTLLPPFTPQDHRCKLGQLWDTGRSDNDLPSASQHSDSIIRINIGTFTHVLQLDLALGPGLCFCHDAGSIKAVGFPILYLFQLFLDVLRLLSTEKHQRTNQQTKTSGLVTLQFALVFFSTDNWKWVAMEEQIQPCCIGFFLSKVLMASCQQCHMVEGRSAEYRAAHNVMRLNGGQLTLFEINLVFRIGWPNVVATENLELTRENRLGKGWD